MAKYSKDDILGFETDTVWGIGCHPLNQTCADKIYEIKGRDKTKPLILMSSEIKNLLPYVQNIPPYAKILMDKHFPGGLTLIFQKSSKCPFFITADKDTVGIRIPDHKEFYNLAQNFEGRVLATTSLNLSNEEPVKNYEEALQKFGNTVKIVEPKGFCPPKGKASTVVLCTGDNPVVLRQGDVVI